MVKRLHDEKEQTMRALRKIYDSMPPMIEIPEDLRARRVEVVFLELGKDETRTGATNADWPDGLFEHTAGAWQGEPLQRSPQGDYEQRLVLE
jgi:hypothetical protein